MIKVSPHFPGLGKGSEMINPLPGSACFYSGNLRRYSDDDDADDEGEGGGYNYYGLR